MRMKNLFAAGVLFLLFTAPAFAQNGSDFQQQLEGLLKQNAEGYVQPVATATGIGLNSGVYHTAKVHKLLGFDVTLNVAGIQIPDSAKYYTFDTSGLGTYTLPQDIGGTSVTLDMSQLFPSVEGAPTFFGTDTPPSLSPNTSYARNAIVSQVADAQGLDPTQVETLYGAQIDQAVSQQLPAVQLPQGVMNQGFWGVPSIQASVGLPFGTEAQVRYLPTYSLPDDAGDISMLGVGGRISLDQFIPIPFFPLDISAGAFFQKIELGPVNVKSHIYHAEIGKTLPVLTLYGGVGMEGSELTASYTYNNPALGGTQDISLSVKGENKFRGTVGFRMKFLILSLSADYNFGTYNSANLGVGLTIR